jgi:hypothetical protein
MNLEFLEEIRAKGMIIDRKVLRKNKIVVLLDVFHCLLHLLLSLTRE